MHHMIQRAASYSKIQSNDSSSLNRFGDLIGNNALCKTLRNLCKFSILCFPSSQFHLIQHTSAMAVLPTLITTMVVSMASLGSCRSHLPRFTDQYGVVFGSACQPGIMIHMSAMHTCFLFIFAFILHY